MPEHVSLGLFVTFEGVEGCGKSTQIQLLSDFLAENDIQHLVTREPGGTPLAEKIRGVLLDPENSSITPLAELLLYAASRTQHLHEKILPAIKRGQIVLCDRFYDSTTAYQGAGRVIEPEIVETITHIAVGDFRPDVTFFIDVPVEIGLARIQQRKKIDRLEAESLSFHQRVRDGYLQLIAREPDRIISVDGTQPIEWVQQRIRDCLTRRYSSFFS